MSVRVDDDEKDLVPEAIWLAAMSDSRRVRGMLTSIVLTGVVASGCRCMLPASDRPNIRLMTTMSNTLYSRGCSWSSYPSP